MALADQDIAEDIAQISGIAVVPFILETICRTTGLGFSAVARVTPERWVACAVRDEISFGLIPGGELVVDTTICHEIRQSGEGVIIDHVAEDKFYSKHHTPARYGFQSYISMPIFRNDGSFYGTLCAIDPNPALLNTPEIKDMFRTYAQLISANLEIPDAANLSEQTLAALRMQLESLTGEGFKEANNSQIAILNIPRGSSEYAGVISKSTARIKELLNGLKVGA
jgi:GAF domain-containing protein